ncbi:MAG: M50 family metallopeptidase [Propionibacteriaceae bacterium]|nr:M50 family metallopeptidase [Propionibacteriaceae bacterium]
METLWQLWRRWWQTAAVPAPSEVLVVGAVALALVVLAWRPVRMLATLVHEAGHAVLGALTGRTLQGIRVHADTSGVTLSRGRPRGPGMVLTLLAGYPAPSLAGLAAAVLIGHGRSVLVIWLFALGAAVMLVRMRNLVGALVALAVGVGLALLAWYTPTRWLPWFATGLAWLLLLAGARTVLEACAHPGGPGSDEAQLAGLTHFPRWWWLGGWLLVAAGAVWLAASWLLVIPAG